MRPIGWAARGSAFWGIFAVCVVPGIVLWVLGSGVATTIGIVLVALSLPFLVIAAGLLGSGVVAHWAARRRPFA